MIENHMVLGSWDAPGCDCQETARCVTCEELPPVAGAEECEPCLLGFYKAFPAEIDDCFPRGEPWDRIKAEVLKEVQS
jgi:hypothetical protein